jgi:hypothetical protein
MSDSETVHVTTIDWSRGAWMHARSKYSHEHALHFVGGAKLNASDAPFMLADAYRYEARLMRRTSSWRVFQVRTCPWLRCVRRS